MKIKQQKQIKMFLVEEFGKDKGNALFNIQGKMLSTLIENTKNKSENQMKTLVQTIFPRIALYKILLKDNLLQKNAYEYIQKYMLNKVAEKKHLSMVRMESVPGFYSIYSKIFLKIMRKTDLQENVQKLEKFGYDIIAPEEGILANGDKGTGRMPSEEVLVNAICEKMDKIGLN